MTKDVGLAGLTVDGKTLISYHLGGKQDETGFEKWADGIRRVISTLRGRTGGVGKAHKDLRVYDHKGGVGVISCDTIKGDIIPQNADTNRPARRFVDRKASATQEKVKIYYMRGDQNIEESSNCGL